jgi:hypothetical protein
MERKTKVEIINYIREYFESHPRAISNGRCVYIDDNGNMCAHSICIQTDFNREEINYGSTAKVVIKLYGDKIHKEEFQGHSIAFWRDIQKFHDYSDNWIETNNGNTLTEVGMNYYLKLIDLYKTTT